MRAVRDNEAADTQKRDSLRHFFMSANGDLVRLKRQNDELRQDPELGSRSAPDVPAPPQKPSQEG